MVTKTRKDKFETYDPQADVLYVSFGTGEPSSSVEIDDILILELGVFSKLPTGFRVLNFSGHKVKSVIVQVKRRLVNTIKKEGFEVKENLKERNALLQQSLDQVFVPA